MHHIGIICALYFEARCFLPGKPPAEQPVKLNQRTSLIVSGMGRERAQRAAQKLVEANVDCLVSFGTAGALSPALRPGDLLLPREVLCMENTSLAGLANTGDPVTQEQELTHEDKLAVPGKTAASKIHPDKNGRYVVSAGLPARAGQRLSRQHVTIHTGPLVCTQRMVTSLAAKRKLFEQTGATAVDMETAGVLEAAQSSGLPAFAARVVVDPADLTLPQVILRGVDAYGQLNTLAWSAGLVRSPGQTPALVRLAYASRRAGKTMKLLAAELLDPGNGQACQNGRSGL